jgi:hypothetical protein
MISKTRGRPKGSKDTKERVLKLIKNPEVKTYLTHYEASPEVKQLLDASVLNGHKKIHIMEALFNSCIKTTPIQNGYFKHSLVIKDKLYGEIINTLEKPRPLKVKNKAVK